MPSFITVSLNVHHNLLIKIEYDLRPANAIT